MKYRVAPKFRVDPRMEDLAALAERDPANLSPMMRMSLGYYMSTKAAAAADEGTDRDD